MVFNTAKLTQFSHKLQIFTARGPAYYYAYGQWRLRRWVQKWSSSKYMISNDGFWRALDLDLPGLLDIKEALGQIEAGEAVTKLAAYFQNRTQPTFFFDQAEKGTYVSLIGQDLQATTLQAAEEICQNIFNFRGAGPVRFEHQPDWSYRPQGNIDWMWDLNRHAYFETLGRAYAYTSNHRYALKFKELLLDWLTKNPAAPTQRNWYNAFEVGFRINVWVWALFLFQDSLTGEPQTCLALLKGLLAHGRYLDANIETHVPNNHLLLEAKALAFLGILFPEFKEAKRWQQRGLNLLFQQIRAQVRPDGVHGEQSTHYHRVITSELLELFVLLDNNQITVPTDILETFGRMVEFELWVTKPNGDIPLLSDSAMADSYLRFSGASGGVAFLDRADLKPFAPPLDESTIWLLGPDRVTQRRAPVDPTAHLVSRSFPAGGYYIMRSRKETDGLYLVFDCGPFGYKPLPNHGHADALSFELHAYGQTLLVDAGVYSTALGQNWRNFFRGTAAHNTVVVDELDQSILMDTRRVYRPAETTLHQWLTHEHFDFVDGSHTGYNRLAEPITHRRQIFFIKPEYWLVIDWLHGQGVHTFDLHFHLMPGVVSQHDPAIHTVYGGNIGQPGLCIAPVAGDEWQSEVITGSESPIQGWVSFFSGEKQAAPTVRFRQQRHAPAQFCTVLYPYQADKRPPIQVSPLPLKLNGQPDSLMITGLQVEIDQYVDFLVIDRSSEKSLKSFGEYETDAQLIYLRHHKQNRQLLKAIAHGGNRLLYQGQPLSATVVTSIIYWTS